MQKNISTRLVIYLLIFFSFFPYIQLVPIGTDSQPYALAVAFFILPFCFKSKMKINLAYLFYIFLFAVFAILISTFSFNSVRSLINYVTLFVVTYVTYFSLRRIKGIPYKFLKYTVYIWFFVGTIQTFVYPNFLTFLLPRGVSEGLIASGRGIIGLAPEPTFYGMMCLIFGMIAYLNFNDKKDIRKIYILLAIQIFIYSRSSLTIFIIASAFCLYIGIKLFKQNGIKTFFAFCIFTTFFYYLINMENSFLASFRVGALFRILMNNPELFLTLDDSVNERFVHVFFPTYGFLENWGLPNGYDNFTQFFEDCKKNSDINYLISDYVYEKEATRIMSGLGSILFELGVIGLLLLKVVSNLCLNVLNGYSKYILFFIFICILMNAIPFSNPLIPFFIGNLMYLKSIKKTNANIITT